MWITKRVWLSWAEAWRARMMTKVLVGEFGRSPAPVHIGKRCGEAASQKFMPTWLNFRQRLKRARNRGFAGPSGQPARRGQNLFGMAGHFDLAPDAGDFAGAVDQQRRAFNAHVFTPIHAFLDPDAIGLEHLLGLVGE